MNTLPERRTLNGKFDGYCHVCWNAVYVLWVSGDDPNGECMYGCKAAHDCPDAMARANTQATLAKLRAAGLLAPQPEPPAKGKE